MRSINFRLHDVEADIMDDLAAELGMSRTDLLRHLVREKRERVGLYEKRRREFVERLIEQRGETARLELEVGRDVSLEASPRINGEPVDLYTIAAYDRDDTLVLVVGDLASDVRIVVGRVPAVDGAQLQLPLAALRTLRSNDVHDVPSTGHDHVLNRLRDA